MEPLASAGEVFRKAATTGRAPLVSSVIVNWNRQALTLECLASVMALDYPPGRLAIIVVDNGSTDGSVPAIRERFPSVTMLETGENLGYAGGNNAGIRYALAQGADYVCLLNNDVTVDAGLLRPLLAVFEEWAGVGVVTPLVAEMGVPERVWALGAAVDEGTGTAARLQAGEPVRDWQDAAPFEVDVAPGTAMLVKREVVERAGLLDEAFYLYYEEVDWCLRARQAGYRILAVPSAVLWHKVSGTLETGSPVVDYYMLRNHLRLIYRHWSGMARVRLMARAVLRNLMTIAAYTAKPHGGARLPHRNARLMALRDAILGRWGRMGPGVEAACGLRGAGVE